MARSFRSIHDKKFLQRVADSSCQFMNTRFQCPFFQWFVLIENRHDHDGNNCHHKDGEAKHKGPHINVKVFSTHFDDFQQQRNERPPDDTRQDQTLHFVGEKESVGLFVEAVFLFNLKSFVEFKRQTLDGIDQGLQQQEYQSDLNFFVALDSKIGSAQANRLIPQKWCDTQKQNCNTLKRLVGTGNHPEIDFVHTVCLRGFEFRLKLIQQWLVFVNQIFLVLYVLVVPVAFFRFLILFAFRRLRFSLVVDFRHGLLQFFWELGDLVRFLLSRIQMTFHHVDQKSESNRTSERPIGQRGERSIFGGVLGGGNASLPIECTRALGVNRFPR
mmetsp:Transcript_18671/g.40651  ORF Transcript_18671/g.40651 Transcript_18671/m.40651 type:complete len:329 (+) Transcript_18671:510-1496(+)